MYKYLPSIGYLELGVRRGVGAVLSLISKSLEFHFKDSKKLYRSVLSLQCFSEGLYRITILQYCY